MNRLGLLCCLFLISPLASCSSDDDDTPSLTESPWDGVAVEVAFPNLEFSLPLALVQPGDGSNRLFVVEQDGLIKVFDNTPQVSDYDVFLDLTDDVIRQNWEQGLLGLAFHPRFSENGYFYVNYTEPPGRTIVSRFSVSDDPNRADKSSEAVILQFDQPYGNHNGGSMQFGPDGYLYIGVGDGGAANDPHGNGQNRRTWLGTILRIDVDKPARGMEYGIPADNPFVGNDSGFAGEIYAWGLRNPWRFSFDSKTGLLWCGDVGQDKVEEVDIVEKGGNYGWNIMEGSTCFNPPEDCDTTGLILPVAEYLHPVGASITGGYVYRGSQVPALAGKYVFADFMTGRIWTLSPADSTGQMSAPYDADLSVSSFGVDADNELYMCVFDGKIYRFTAE